MDSSTSGSRSRSQSNRGVRVVGKIRPFYDLEMADHSNKESSNCCQVSITRSEGGHASVAFGDQSNGRKDSYKLDWCYEQDEGASEIFSKEVRPLIQGLFQGSNACVIAYGARGSGKTRIVQGSEETPGLAPIAISEIIELAKEINGSVSVSCFEICQDHIYDILQPSKREVLVLEDAGRKIQLKGLSQVTVDSISEFKSFYFPEPNQRKPSQKVPNEVGTRGHRGLIIYVSRVDEESNNSLIGKMIFMDLAGYEDCKPKNNDRPHLVEGSKVNKSLYALINVVYALNSSEAYVPYRESKLTRLLQDFICKTSRAVLITCLNPTLCQDTLYAVRLASRSCQLCSTKINKSVPRFISSCSPFKGAIGAPNASLQKGEQSQFATSVKKGNETPFLPKRRPQPSGTSTTTTPRASLMNSIKKKPNDTSSNISGKKLFSSSTISLKDNNLMDNKEIEVPLTDESVQGGPEADNTDHVVLPITPELDICTKEEQDDLQAADLGAKLVDGAYDDSLRENTPVSAQESSPKLSDKLKEISNALKLLSTQQINIGTPKADASCVKQNSDLMDPKTPIVPFNQRLDSKSKFQCADTPQDLLITRSTGLKRSLVQDCLAFLNSANKEELKGLKGIGDKRATYILQLREETPEPFKEVDDLKDLGLSSKQIKRMMSGILDDFSRS
ncbi:kinesin-like protein KIN-10B [Typha angustifolia]|uniref:kinesin-like protein KIN-10B n=1 Tax=Typha angustifolia TaxID=59011 RepID=UPI003C2F02E4